jgi:hypothetical protein
MLAHHASSTTHFGDVGSQTTSSGAARTSASPRTVVVEVIRVEVIRQLFDPAKRYFLERLNQLSGTRRGHVERLFRLVFAALGFICLSALVASALAQGQHEPQTLRIAVYDVPPYGYVDSDGSISGVSVDLWRRVAEQME